MINLTDRKFDGALSDPQIADVFSLMKRETMLDINCVQVGTINSYNSTTNTAQVSINVKRPLKNGTELEYPTLEDCPVFMLYGGSASITMPISSGDGCLVLFNDRCMDDWFLIEDVVAPTDKRVHSLSDGIVLVGVKPMTKQTIPVPSSLCINGGDNKISIKNSNPVGDLKKILDKLINTIAGLTTINCVVGAPVTLSPATIAALTGATGIITEIAALLE
jgi:hypothetical protein